MPILDFLGTARTFNFETGAIRRGKALASERYITLPLGDSDQDLLSQSPLTKPELMGRPLDGIYGLRVYDQPSLNWDHVEDIQLVLRYRYWSRVERE